MIGVFKDNKVLASLNYYTKELRYINLHKKIEEWLNTMNEFTILEVMKYDDDDKLLIQYELKTFGKS